METRSMNSFFDNLRELPSVEQIARLELLDSTGAIIGVIDNRPGSAGSVAIYYAATMPDRRLDRCAAEQAAQLYAEHVADARKNPGKHPNIDRLFQIMESNTAVQVRIIKSAT